MTKQATTINFDKLHINVSDFDVNNDKIRLTKSEKKIYDAVMAAFPATNHESALDKALQGGVEWQFHSR